LASVRSILVTPFRSIDATSAQSYLEVGMAESLATRLGRIDRLRVPPLAAVRADEDLFAAARRLSIDAVLSGSVQRDADRLRVTAQLSRAGDGQILWNESFDQSFTDIFAVQDAIAERLAAGVVRGLSSSDRALLTRRYTSNAEAYDLYLRAREQWTRRTPEAVRAAIRMYDNAIALDPSFALAYAGLADAYNITRSGLPAAVRYPLAKGAAERAVALDPHLSEAHTSLGFLRYKFEQNWPDAEAEFVRAIELNPINALARHWHAESLFLRGRYDESLGEYRRALELDPFSTALYYDAVRCAVRGGKVGEARSLIDDALALAPQEPRLQDGLSMVLFAEGRHREGMEALAQYLVLDGYTVAQAETLRAGFAHGGMTAMYAAWITLLEPRAAKGASQAATLLAETYGRLGDHARALQWLKRAFDLREDARIRLVSNAGYDSLRSRPEFQAFLREAGFPGEASLTAAPRLFVKRFVPRRAAIRASQRRTACTSSLAPYSHLSSRYVSQVDGGRVHRCSCGRQPRPAIGGCKHGGRLD
ncbi:MAG TPA: tetratricopeptide repeat protein, partial [Vicinamibacterales bacterium]|nr:tetratricopeptide repeat protein [Vicinamibacterales bacterium]